MLGAAAPSAAGDDAADRAQLHPQIVGTLVGGVYSPTVLRLPGQAPAEKARYRVLGRKPTSAICSTARRRAAGVPS
jgi:hypothetical protein